MEQSGGWGCKLLGNRAGFGIVMKKTLYLDCLSIEAKAIYSFLAVHADKDGYSFPEVSTICDYLKIGEERFYKHMAQLKAAGVVEVTRKREGTKFSHNVYKLTDRDNLSDPTIPFLENQYPENLGIELPKSHILVLPPTEIQYPGGVGTNNTTLNSTRRLNNTNKDIYEQICDFLNAGKRKAGSKGRLKTPGAHWAISDLEQNGVSKTKIIQAAQEVADQGIDLDWYAFGDFVKYRKIPGYRRR